MTAPVIDTYAEAFRSIYAEVLITARDETWLKNACHAATGHAASTIMCDSEAAVDCYVGPGSAAFGGDDTVATPDNRPGAVVQFHVPRFRKDRREHLEKVLLARISQNVLTCPTARCFNLLDGDALANSGDYFKLGRKVALFGDGFQKRDIRFDRKVWTVPILGGEFVLDRRFGFRDGIMGGNLWFLGETEDAAIDAAERALVAVGKVPGVTCPFPGGIAASGSKAGSRYSFMFASTFEQYCPTLKEKLGEESRVPEGVASIMEIILNGRDLATVATATHAAIDAARETPGLVQITGGNYGGRLGKSFIYLLPERHAAETQ